MRFPNLTMPDGWPWSLWFFVATAVVYLLQRFPPTGIFLMLFLAMFWSVILVNAGFIGIGIEALTGRVSLAWLLLPLLYFGGYYAFYAKDQAALAAARAHYAKFNSGKSLPFDPARQDVIFQKGKGDFHPTPQDFVRRFGLKRAFDANGLVHFIGDKDACALVRGNDVYRSAGIYSFGFQTEGDLRHRQFSKDIALSMRRALLTGRPSGSLATTLRRARGACRCASRSFMSATKRAGERWKFGRHAPRRCRPFRCR
jgi:hypothetical protein